MRSTSRISIYSRLFLIAGLADILASLLGFIFGAILIVTGASLHLKRQRPIGALIGPISLAIAAFVSLRTVIALLFPSSAYTSAFQYGPLLSSIMSPSPIFTYFLSGPIAPISYSEAMAWVDIIFNSAALLLNFLGLGTVVWGWSELLGVETETLTSAKPQSAGLPQ